MVNPRIQCNEKNELNGSERVIFHTELFASSVNVDNYHSILNLNKALCSDLVIRKCFITGSFHARENVSDKLHVYH